MGTLVFSIFGSILLFLVLGAPIGFAILIGTFVSMLLLHLPGSMMMLRMASGTQSFVLTAIPFFTLAGVLMREGGITRRITDCCLLLVGHLKGSLGHVNVVASMIFGGISGSSVADTASIGNVLIPEMVDKKYPANFSTAITAVSSTIGVIIPPSIPMILYSIAGEVSIGRLFLAGAIPGLMVGILQMCINSFMSNKHDFPKAREKMPRFGEIIKGFRHGIFAIGMPVLIVGGIVAGIVTATE